jgi:transcriptional regulator with XRE-family HTH domain
MLLNDKLKARRIELGLTMLDVAKSVGVSEATISRWESGNIGNMRRDKIALYAKALNTSPLFIMGIDENEPNKSNNTNIKKRITLSSHELNVIEAYRNKPDMQPVVDKILDVNKEKKHILFSAARSENGQSPMGTVELTEEEYQRLINAPETDEDL